MRIEDILKLDDTDKMLSILCVDTRPDREPIAYLEEYRGKRERRVESIGYRLPKVVDIYSDTETNDDGSAKKIGKKFVPQAKITTNTPRKIVSVANAFLFGGDMHISFSEQGDVSEYFRQVFEWDLKMKSVFSNFAEVVMSETKSAIIFFPVTNPADKTIRIRSKILSNKNNEFYPHFDEYGDMDAFVRKYKAMHTDGEEREFVWIQTAQAEHKYVKIDGTWQHLGQKPNLARKITVVYAEQDEPEWESIVSSLDKLEMRLSRLVDTNDYFSEPILKSFGETRAPTKDTVGKTLEYDIEVCPESGKKYHGDAQYLVWEQSVDAIRLELDALRGEIHGGTSTPDLSFENLKSLGNISGVGMKLMFLDAFIKAGEKMRIFTPAVQRSVAIVKALIGNVAQTKYRRELEKNRIQVSFRSVLPDDLKEFFDILTKANGDKPINSQETITALSPFTANAEVELERLNKEQEKESGISLTGTVIQ